LVRPDFLLVSLPCNKFHEAAGLIYRLLRLSMTEIKASKSKAALKAVSVMFLPLLFGLTIVASGVPEIMAIGLIFVTVSVAFVYRCIAVPLLLIDGQNIVCLNFLGRKSRTLEAKSTALVLNKSSLYIRPETGNDFILNAEWFTKNDWLVVQASLKSLEFREVI
jgi:hypothetical protein